MRFQGNNNNTEFKAKSDNLKKNSLCFKKSPGEASHNKKSVDQTKTIDLKY